MFTVTQCMSSWSLYTHRLVSVMYLWPAPDKYSHTLTWLTNYKFNWLVINLLPSDQSDTSIAVPYHDDHHIDQGSDLSSCLIYPNPCHNNLKQESTLRAAFLAHPLTFLPLLLYYGQFITDFLEHYPNLFQSLHMHRLLLLLLLLYSDLFPHSFILAHCQFPGTASPELEASKPITLATERAAPPSIPYETKWTERYDDYDHDQTSSSIVGGEEKLWQRGQPNSTTIYIYYIMLCL